MDIRESTHGDGNGSGVVVSRPWVIRCGLDVGWCGPGMRSGASGSATKQEANTMPKKKKELQQHDDPRHFNRPISGRHLELHAKKIRETNLLSSIHYMQ